MVRTFGAPVIDPAGNRARIASTATHRGPQGAAHGRDQLVHRGEGLDPEQVRDVHRSGRTDAREVVADQIDDHQVLGAVLLD